MNRTDIKIIKKFKEDFIKDDLDVIDVGSAIVRKQKYLGSFRDIFLKNKYIGVDVAEGENVDLVVDGYNLPFGSSTFPALVSANVLEHVTQPQRVLKEWFRIVSEGGYACIITPFSLHYHAVEDLYEDYWRFSHKGLEVLAILAGFEIVESGIIESKEGRHNVSDAYVIIKKPKLYG